MVVGRPTGGRRPRSGRRGRGAAAPGDRSVVGSQEQPQPEAQSDQAHGRRQRASEPTAVGVGGGWRSAALARGLGEVGSATGASATEAWRGGRRRGGRWRRGGGRDALEDLAVGGAQEEDGRGPFRTEVGVERLAGARDRLVHRQSVGQGSVEVTREGDGRAVGDGELHGDDGGRVLLDQALGHAAVGVGLVDVGGAAGVEDDEPKRVVVADEGSEHRRGDRRAATVVVAEVQDPFLEPRVELTVPDEVQHVDVIRAQPLTQLADRRLGQPVDDDQARRDPVRERLLDPGELRVAVQLGKVRRGGGHHEDPQRPGDGERPDRRGDVEVADERRPLRLGDEGVAASVVEQLPRQPGEGRCVGQAQPQPESLAGTRGGILTAAPGEREVVAEDRVEQRTAEVPSRLDLGVLGDPSGAGPTGVELEEEVLQDGRRRTAMRR